MMALVFASLMNLHRATSIRGVSSYFVRVQEFEQMYCSADVRLRDLARARPSRPDQTRKWLSPLAGQKRPQDWL
jgi:hypothetical protein